MVFTLHLKSNLQAKQTQKMDFQTAQRKMKTRSLISKLSIDEKWSSMIDYLQDMYPLHLDRTAIEIVTAKILCKDFGVNEDKIFT